MATNAHVQLFIHDIMKKDLMRILNHSSLDDTDYTFTELNVAIRQNMGIFANDGWYTEII